MFQWFLRFSEFSESSTPFRENSNGSVHTIRLRQHQQLLYSPIEFFTNIQGWQYWHYCQLCVPTYLQFSSLFITTDVSKYEIRNQWVYDYYILRPNATLDWLIFSDRAKTKLAMLAFFYYGEIVKNSITSKNKSQLQIGQCERAISG